MINVNADCIVSIYENARHKVDSVFELLDENLLWLEEIQEEARKAFQSNSISLLPKTPGIKRKRAPLSSQNGSSSPTKCSSTFVDEFENKKFKIDDMSTIAEITDVSLILDDTQNTTRSLRPRKKKSAPRPVKKSKRIVKQRVTNLNQSLENKKTSFVVQETPSPITADSTMVIDQEQSTVINETISKLSPINHPIQPHVASIIQQLAKSSHKPTNKSISTPVNPLDDVKISLFGYAPDPTHSSSPCYVEKICTLKIEQITTPLQATPVPETSKTLPSIAKSVSVGSEMTPLHVDETCDLTDKDFVENTTVDAEKVIEKGEWVSVDEEKDSGVSSDEKSPLDQVEDKDAAEEPQPSVMDNSKEQSGRRDTYKVMVQQAHSPCKSDSKGILYDLQNISVKQTSSPFSTTSSFNLSKGPKIFKPVTSTLSKNIVTGVKSFLNRGTTPPRKTKEELQQQKVADLEKKEQQRQKALEEANQRKQKLIEMKKKQRADREKRLADIHAKRHEEEERKRKEMEIRNNKCIKNFEEIKRQRELEEKKKRELREMKNAIAEQRRQKEEELQQRKLHQQLEEEERRCEMMKRKMEYEEQERLRRKQVTEKEERERLRALEKENQLQEDRKIRELEEKEKHRQEVERKLKEERGREKNEKQRQEQRLKQAEQEIADANKKRELDISTTKNPILNLQNTKLKTYSPGIGKENMVKATYKNSPTLSKATIKNKAPLLLPLKLRESTYTSYSIDDLNSDDSTDDESEPCKRIPSWAQGIELKTQLIYQFHNNVDPENIFTHCMEPCRLEKIFLKNKERYFKRTSSAHWDSPLLKTKVYR